MRVIFVYGTLRKGGAYHHVLGDSKFLGEAEVPGIMFSLGRFPGAQFGVSDRTVKGELYSVSADVMSRTDALEGFFEARPEISMYVRRRVEPFINGVKGKPVWAYEYRNWLGDTGIVVSGDWIQHLSEQKGGLG